MNNDLPRVSIVIPCYNYGRYLDDAITSALSQSVSPTQIIVVDDGSEDDTRAVVRRYEDAVEYQAIPHSGISSARNEGLRRASGDFIVFLDADDALDPCYLEKTIEARSAASMSPAFVYTQRRDFETGGDVSKYPAFDPERLKFRNYIMVSALLETSVAREQAFDPGFAGGLEDYDFFLGLVEKGYAGLLLDEPLLRVRRHEGSRTLSSGDADLRWLLMRRLLKKHEKLYSRKDKRMFMERLRRYMAHHLAADCDAGESFKESVMVLAKLVRYRVPVSYIYSQLGFMARRLCNPVRR